MVSGQRKAELSCCALFVMLFVMGNTTGVKANECLLVANRFVQPIETKTTYRNTLLTYLLASTRS
jgi:hypothetical protein